MLGLQNILQKKKISYKVMWYNMIEKEMNPNFEKFNHVVPHHFLRVFFFFFLISLAFLFLVSIQSIGWQYMSQGKNIYKKK
jgi:hypothetical protein